MTSSNRGAEVPANTDRSDNGDFQQIEAWLAENDIKEVECLVSDVAGIARGKVLRTERFLVALRANGLHLAESLYSQDVQGNTIFTTPISPLEPDIVLHADLDSLRRVPWREIPTASVLCDAKYHSGDVLPIAPRQVLRHVVELLQGDGFAAAVAPELEFHLLQAHCDPVQPLSRPTQRSGAAETGSQAYAIDMLRDYGALFDDLYRYCDTLGIPVEVLTHEVGPGQFEINIDHGDPLKKADEVFMFKRAAREAALKHGKIITFMAKPIANEPGNAMHIHQSITRLYDGSNIFSSTAGEDSKSLLYYLGGLQKYIPAVLLLFAPYVNSYRRFVPNQYAPVNTHWSHENRTVGLRVPHSNANNRRVENRVIGADANPYLAIAATLACGILGLKEKIMPGKEMLGDAAAAKSRTLPQHLLLALENMRRSKALKEVFHSDFLALFSELKYAEYQEFSNVVTAWEREHLLYTV